MFENVSWGKRNRLASIVAADGHALMLAIDHGYFMGPTSGMERPAEAIKNLVPYIDSLMLSPGILTTCIPADFAKGIVLRASGGNTVLDADIDDEEIILEAEEAVKLNASAVAISVFIGADHGHQTIMNLTDMINAASKLNLPVLGVTGVGKALKDRKEKRYLAHASRIVAELGADIVKTYYCEGFEEVVIKCPAPHRRRGGTQARHRQGRPGALLQRDPVRRHRRGHGAKRLAARLSRGDHPGRPRHPPRGAVRQGGPPAGRKPQDRGDQAQGTLRRHQRGPRDDQAPLIHDHPHGRNSMQEKMKAVAPAPLPEVLVSMDSIWKFFAGVAVLRGVDIDLRVGEVHALLGGNGSGKSTLMKILSGAYVKDRGSLSMMGRELELSSPEAAHQEGIYLVPQEPKVFPNMSVFENIICGMRVNRPEMLERVAAYAADLGLEGDLQDPASTLSIANQQLVEIIRGLVREARVLILDEPTSTLTFKEVASLFERMRVLSSRGIGIFFISHRLDEVFAISDRVSVLRDGVIVLSEPKSEIGSQDVIRAMLPAADCAEASAAASTRARVPADAPEIFRVEALSGYGFTDISFSLRRGEVLGFAGVVGAGRTELAHAILGLDEFATGKVFMKGQDLGRDRSPGLCLGKGLAYVPEDRHLHGIFLDLPNVQTMSAGVLRGLGRFLISRKREAALASRYIADLRIKVSSGSQLSRTLSGGNQQKVVLAKILAGDPEVVILDEPTRGVDAKARQDVYKLIRELSLRGIGVILISSDLPEVIQESDRILVMHNGRIETEFPGPDFDLELITASAFGLSKALPAGSHP